MKCKLLLESPIRSTRIRTLENTKRQQGYTRPRQPSSTADGRENQYSLAGKQSGMTSVLHRFGHTHSVCAMDEPRE